MDKSCFFETDFSEKSIVTKNYLNFLITMLFVFYKNRINEYLSRVDDIDIKLKKLRRNKEHYKKISQLLSKTF